jgi:peptidylprolyl isomerase
LALERPRIEKAEGDIPFELVVEDLVVGEGDEATKGSKVAVHYVGVSFSTGEGSTLRGIAASRSSSSSAGET